MSAILDHDSKVLQAKIFQRKIFVLGAVQVGSPWRFYLDNHNITIFLSLATELTRVGNFAGHCPYLSESAECKHNPRTLQCSIKNNMENKL